MLDRATSRFYYETNAIDEACYQDNVLIEKAKEFGVEPWVIILAGVAGFIVLILIAVFIGLH